MNIQYIIVGLILISAFAYAGSVLWKKTRSLSAKAGCDSDCGCNGKTKNLTS